MKGWIFLFTGVFICTVIYTAAQVVVSSTTQKPIPNKNSTLNAVTEAILEPITTTRRPLLQGLKIPCSCLQGQCGCCTGVILERFKQKACMNITYEPDDFSFTAAFSLNGRVLYRNSISGKNPPPICIRLPRFRFVQLCVEFSNIYFANRNMHVCIDMEANWESLTLLDFSFDCIRMGVNGVAVVGPEEGGGVPSSPVDEEEQTDEDYDDSARNNIPYLQINKIPIKKYMFINQTNMDLRKSNYPNYKDYENNSNEENSTQHLRNVSRINVKKIPIGVKRLNREDFLIIFNGTEGN